MSRAVSVAEGTARALHAHKLVVIDDAGHLPQVEQPEAFVDAVEAFVATLPGAGEGPAGRAGGFSARSVPS